MQELNRVYDIKGLTKEQNTIVADLIQKMNKRKIKLISSQALQTEQQQALSLIREARNTKRLSPEDAALLKTIEQNILRGN